MIKLRRSFQVVFLVLLAGCASLETTTSPVPIISPTITPTAIPATPTPTISPTIPPTAIPATPTGEIKIGQHPYPYQVQIETADNLTKTVALNYLLYLPSDYGKDPKQKWPLMLYLHGKGEMGDDLELLKNQPLPKTLEQESDFPFIVLSPQLPLEMEYWSDPVIDQLDVLLDKIQELYSIDNKRVYLTGLSLGGGGAWDYALRYPQRFAAVVPIAGFYEYDSDAIPDNICELKDLPMWVFHGAQDTIVMPGQSEILVDALEACGGNVRFTLYPDADHEAAWIQAYADPELFEWLLEQRLSSKKQVLMVIPEESVDMALMLEKEVGVMESLIEGAGYKVMIASPSGQPLSATNLSGSTFTVTPDMKLADVKVGDYMGVILPCLGIPDVTKPPSEAVEIVKEAIALGMPIAAQVGGVFTLGEAGGLAGKQYAWVDSLESYFPDSIYKGFGVIQDGNIMTSGTCPYMAQEMERKDGTTELTQKFIDTLAAQK